MSIFNKFMHQLAHMKKLGMGNDQYELVRV
jgi:hypothetical protein